MNIDEIIRLLQNSGVHVLGADSTSVHIEDPSCIMRGFETFAQYAWVIIVAITAFLLTGWAISLIRGAKTDIVTNLRNLFLMFVALAMVGPIINVIYNGDVFSIGCATIEVPIQDLNNLLTARHQALSNRGDQFYENLQISDSGVMMPIPNEADTNTPAEIIPIANWGDD